MIRAKPKSFLKIPEEKRDEARRLRKNQLSKRWRKTHKQYQKSYRKNHPKETPEHRRMRKLKINYSMTVEQYNELFMKQNGVCKICGQPSKHGSLSVDHDHKTGKVRGLLCRTCNFGITHFKDDTRNLRLAIDYLEKN